MKEEKKIKCVQCGKEMITSYGNEHIGFPFCDDPECPNYGLLQTGILPKKRRINEK